MGFRGPNGHHNNVLDDRTDAHCEDRYTQGLSNALLVSRTNRVLSEIRWVIHKSLFGGATAKSDLARSGFVHTVGKTSIAHQVGRLPFRLSLIARPPQVLGAASRG
jgi:hypothetical protein